MNQKGFLLMASYMLISVLSILSLAIFARSNSYLISAERNQRSVIAFHMAESALDQAIAQLRDTDNTYYPCADDYDSDGDGINEGCSTSFSSMNTDGNVFQGGYQIWVTDPGVDSEYRQIRVGGHSPADGSASTAGDCIGASSTDRAYQCRATESFVELDDSVMEHALFSENVLKMNGASGFVDSYDGTSAYGGENMGNEGDVGSNGSLADGSIDLNGDPTINGEIKENVGIECDAPGYDPPIDSMGTKNVKNTETTIGEDALVYRYSSLTVSGNPGTQLNIGTDDPTHPNYGDPITIYVDGDVSVTSNGVINANSPVTFYVEGSLNFSGNGVVTSDDNPANLIVIMTASGDVDISGGSEFHGAVFAPDSDVDVNGGVNIFGALFGTDVDTNGSDAVHYDTNLANMQFPCVNVKLKAWKEKYTHFS